MGSSLRLRLRFPMDTGAEESPVVLVTLEAIDGHGTHKGRPLRAYVVRERGIEIGTVYETTETLERRTRGKMYVNARWTGAKTVWRAGTSRYTSQTRQDAIARLLRYTRAERVTA